MSIDPLSREGPTPTAIITVLASKAVKDSSRLGAKNREIWTNNPGKLSILPVRAEILALFRYIEFNRAISPVCQEFSPCVVSLAFSQGC